MSNTPAVGRGSDLFERYTGRPAPDATPADRAVLAQMISDLVHLAATVDGFDLDRPDAEGSVVAEGVRAAVGRQREPGTTARMVRAPVAGPTPRPRPGVTSSGASGSGSTGPAGPVPVARLRTALRGTLLTLAAETDDDAYAPQVSQDASPLPTRTSAALRAARAG